MKRCMRYLVLAMAVLAGSAAIWLGTGYTSALGAESGLQATANATIYYVDCMAGQDSNPGTSPELAWKSINRANNANLQPGNKLLLKRGCAWVGPLRATWHGTAAQPITIGAYGTGDLPRIQDSFAGNVQILGSYQIIEYIETTLTTPPNPDPRCNNQPVGWKVGFGFGANSSYNTLQYARANNLAIGVYLDYSSHHNRVLHNELTDNHVLWQLNQSGALGAMGILLHGDHHEIAYNYFANNRTICTYNGIVESNSIELHGARFANIRHNISYYDRVFSELGSSATYPSHDNVYAYNLHVVGPSESQTGSRFLVTRGQGHQHGPVWRTTAYNNTIYHTGEDSKGITCQLCSNEVLKVKNNIFWVDREPISSNGPFIEENNIFWSTLGNPLVHFTPSQTSHIADPVFIDRGAQDFRLQSNSPARLAGNMASVGAGYNYDLAQTPVPQGGAVDIGAYEAPDTRATGPDPDPTPPIIECSISVDEGALYTASRTVQVRANVTGAVQMMVSNDAGFTGAVWQAYQPEFDWLLRDTEGRIATLLVYARFVDGAQTPLCGPGHLSDDIIYDPIPPTVTVAIATQHFCRGMEATRCAYHGTESGGDALAAHQNPVRTVHLNITAQDQENGSGLDAMQVSLDEHFMFAVAWRPLDLVSALEDVSDDGSSWQAFTPSVAIAALPGQTVYVRVRDHAGNVSAPAWATVPAQNDSSPGLFLPALTGN